MNNLRSEFDEEPQYDYAYSNEELYTPEERRQAFLNGVKGLVTHVAHRFTDVAMDMGKDTEVPKFNSTLSLPDHFSNATNPLAPEYRTRTSSSVRPQKKRIIRNMRSSRVYNN